MCPFIETAGAVVKVASEIASAAKLTEGVYKALDEGDLESAIKIIAAAAVESKLGSLSDAKSKMKLPDASGAAQYKMKLPDAMTLRMPEEKIDAPEKKGGSYKEVKENSEGDTYEVHHMPADSASPLERNDGPAIRMEKDDHRQTASCGNSKEARDYRAQQQELIAQGKFRDALQMDIDDIRDKFGNKYDDAIEEMLKYVDKLEQEGKISG